MEDFRQDYVRRALTVVIFFFITILGFFLKSKISSLISWIWKKIDGKENISEGDFQKDIMDIKKATEQVVQDWMGMSKLISQTQSDQSIFVNRLQTLFEHKSEMLEQDISAALEEVFKRNDQRFQEMRLTIESMQNDIQSMKNFLQALVQSSSEFDGKADDEENGTDIFAQTGCEMKRKERFDAVANSIKKKNGNVDNYDTSKLITTLKKCLTDLFKDAKLHLSVDREEENRELEIILGKLAEDREDIKKTILEAFSIAAEQAKKNYDQFGQIGEDALKYIAVLNDNTNKLLQSKLDETDDVLKNTLSVVNRQTFDIDAVKKVIENMDGQFGELFEKLAEIYHINMEHYEAIALSMERTSDNWIQAVSKIEKMAKQICDDTKNVKQIFQEIKDLANTPPQIDADNQRVKEISEIINKNTVDSITIQDQQILSQKKENMVFVYSCWERMRSVSCNVEDGCHSVCKLICGLEQKLGSLNESIEKLDEFIRGLNLDNLAERAPPLNYCEDTANIVDDIMHTNQGDAGDGHSQVITSRLRNKSLVHKIQNAVAIDNAIKLTEIILRKVCGKNNNQDSENLPHSKPNNTSVTAEELSSNFVTDEERNCHDLGEPQVRRTDINKTNEKKSL